MKKTAPITTILSICVIFIAALLLCESKASADQAEKPAKTIIYPMTKEQVLDILEKIVKKCGDDCSCGTEASACREKALDEEIKKIAEKRNWEYQLYSKVQRWFYLNSDDPFLIKANNRHKSIDKRYQQFINA